MREGSAGGAAHARERGRGASGRAAAAGPCACAEPRRGFHKRREVSQPGSPFTCCCPERQRLPAWAAQSLAVRGRLAPADVWARALLRLLDIVPGSSLAAGSRRLSAKLCPCFTADRSVEQCRVVASRVPASPDAAGSPCPRPARSREAARSASLASSSPPSPGMRVFVVPRST